MADVYLSFKKYIEQNNLFGPKDSVLAAVSGGADSMCMLELLIRYCREHDNRLGVVHVNHGFREEAVEEAAYVRDYCEERGISFFLREIQPGECKPTEEAARIFRYDLINEVADKEGYTRISLAHNAQDRAETMLFNMFRGTGITGLIGIRPMRERYIRPVLFMDRADIEEFLNEQKVVYYTDATNLEDDYSRNRIRHHIIPQAKQINEAGIRHMSELSDRLIEIEDYLLTVVDEAFSQTVSECENLITIDLDTYCSKEEIIRKELIRKAIINLTPHLKDITSEHLLAVDRLAMKQGMGKLELPYQISVVKEYNKIIISNLMEEGEAFCPVRIDTEALKEKQSTEEIIMNDGSIFVFRIFKVSELGEAPEKVLPRNEYTKWFDYDKINGSLDIRNRGTSDSMIIDKDGHTKSLNRIMIDSKIPERIRDYVPVLAIENEVIWLVGIRDSYAFRIDQNTQYIVEIKYWRNENG